MRPSPLMPSLEVRREPGETIIALRGCETLDEQNSLSFGQQLSQLPDAVPRDRLILDLSGIRFVTSTALGVLVGFNRRVHLAGGLLMLSNVGPFVREAIAVTRLDQLLEVLPPDREEHSHGRQTA
jgi:anti-anti-sigma factor